MVVAHILEALRAEHLPAAALGRLDAEDVTVAPTPDRRSLGTVNDHAGFVGHVIAAHGGIRVAPTQRVAEDVWSAITQARRPSEQR